MTAVKTSHRVDALLLAVLGSLAAYVLTIEVGKTIWLVAFGAGFVVAMVLSVWKPAAWLAIGLGTPVLVLLGFFRTFSLAGPTGQALGLAMMLVWSFLSVLGAGLGYTLRKQQLQSSSARS